MKLLVQWVRLRINDRTSHVSPAIERVCTLCGLSPSFLKPSLIVLVFWVKKKKKKKTLPAEILFQLQNTDFLNVDYSYNFLKSDCNTLIKIFLSIVNIVHRSDFLPYCSFSDRNISFAKKKRNISFEVFGISSYLVT